MGVLADNIFVFARTRNSELNCSGWHCMKDVCKNLILKREDLINATNNRHRISTLYAALDVPESEREIFYRHMGHSAEMNRDVYQAPLALKTVITVGKKLMEFAGGINHVFPSKRKLDFSPSVF